MDKYKKTRIIMAIFAVLIAVLYCMVVFIGKPFTYCVSRVMPDSSLSNEMEDINQDEKDIKELVEAFGKTLQKVTLTSPKNIAAESIEKNYEDYVMPELLKEWKDDIQNAAGRMTSSPWPDRIEILKIEFKNKDQYIVTGEIIEVTSEELEKRGMAAKRPVTIVVKKVKNQWLISSLTMGEYV